jgi:hypothetical protein
LINTSSIFDSIVWFYNSTAIGFDSIHWAKEGGSYNFIIHREVCGEDTSQMVNLLKNAQPMPDLGTDTAFCIHWFGASFSPTLPLDTTGFDFINYKWNTGDSTKYLSLLDYVPLVGTSDTSKLFYVQVSDSNGCKGIDSIYVTYKLCAGISDEPIKSLKAYPNPVQNTLQIVNLPTGNYHLVIFDTQGKVVLEKDIQQVNLSVEDLSPGLYFGQLQGRNQVYLLKFVKE